jgi:undecaprenyl phosphate-alpha-L-ara4FN deformylase
MGLLGLKIDVDTYWGMKNGVPRLLQVFRDFQVRGTFFLSIGPDNSGRAVFQLLKNPLFLKKMLRTKAASLYGWRTALYGTLLPAPKIALSFPELVHQIIQDGHEVQFHAWDHRRWQDELPDKTEPWIQNWFASGIRGFEELTGHKPSSFGAPSWLIDERVLKIIAGYRFDYLSCTRAKSPFIHEDISVLEIPSDLPCFEELDPEKDVEIICNLIHDGGTHVLPVHAEVEGGIFEEKFKKVLSAAFASGMQMVPLNDIRSGLDIGSLPVRKHRMSLLPGRASSTAV